MGGAQNSRSRWRHDCEPTGRGHLSMRQAETCLQSTCMLASLKTTFTAIPRLILISGRP